MFKTTNSSTIIANTKCRTHHIRIKIGGNRRLTTNKLDLRRRARRMTLIASRNVISNRTVRYTTIRYRTVRKVRQIATGSGTKGVTRL